MPVAENGYPSKRFGAARTVTLLFNVALTVMVYL